MPNRYVREGIITSEAVCSLSWPAEVFYRRLINKVDDFGRYTAHHALLRAALYPLQLEKVREADMPRHLAECERAGLLSVYCVESKQYLALHKWEKGRATVSQYPAPPQAQVENGEPIASGGKFSGATGGLGDVGAIAPNLGASAPKNPPIPTTTTTTTTTTIGEWQALPAVLSTDRFKAKWMEYCAYRRENRIKPLGAHSIHAKWKELEAIGESAAVEAIDHSIANGWTGIFPPKNNGRRVAPRSGASQPQHRSGDDEL